MQSGPSRGIVFIQNLKLSLNLPRQMTLQKHLLALCICMQGMHAILCAVHSAIQENWSGAYVGHTGHTWRDILWAYWAYVAGQAYVGHTEHTLRAYVGHTDCRLFSLKYADQILFCRESWVFIWLECHSLCFKFYCILISHLMLIIIKTVDNASAIFWESKKPGFRTIYTAVYLFCNKLSCMS